MNKTKDCKCQTCRAACQHIPGRFLPGEAEKTAAAMGLSMKEFFDKYLGVNWWEDDSDCNVPDGHDKLPDTFFLAPATTNMVAGAEYPGDPLGTCVFFKDGLCQIHDTKPFECRDSMCGETRETICQRSRSIAEAWVNHQEQVKSLLGRQPETAEMEVVSIFDMLRW